MLLDAIEETFFLEQIARRVAGQRELGKHGHIGARLGSALGKREDLLSIAAEVPDGGVGLRERDLHR